MSPRLLWQIASVEARKRMSYRVDFWLSALVSMLVTVGVATFVMGAIFREAGRAEVGGFTLSQVVIYYVLVTLVSRLVTASEMDSPIATDIYEGALSRYLLYPAPYPLVKYAQQIGATFPAVIQIVVFAGWMPFALGLPEGMTAGSVAMGLAAIVLATVLQFLILWPLQAVAFWADNVWSIVFGHRIVSRLLGGMLLPLALFPEGIRGLLHLLPFRLLFAFPVETLLGRIPPHEWARDMGLATLWCLVAAAVGTVVWRRGDLRYTGVGI